MSSKNHKKNYGFCSKQYSLQVSNLNRASKARNNSKRKETQKKNGFHNQKTRKKNDSKIAAQMSSMLAMIPIEENLNSIESHVNI